MTTLPAGWTKEALGDLTQSIRKRAPEGDSEGEFTYIDLSSIDQQTKQVTAPTVIAVQEAPSRARQVVAAGDVLVSTVRPNLNGVATVPGDLDGSTASTGFTVLRPKRQRLDGRYLFHWVRSPSFVESMVRLSTGASYPAVSDRIVKSSTLPLPPLDDQRRIAAILDRADELRAKRRVALEQLDTLTQSIFLDMFGHPLGESTHPRVSIAQLAAVTTGRTPPSSKAGMFGGPIPFVTPGDLESDREPVRTLTDAGADHSRVVRPGATLVCCIGTVGKVGRALVPSAFNQQINAVEWGDSVADEYGFAALEALKPLIKSRAASTTLPLLNKRDFQALEIPVPPLEDQRLFAKRVEAIREQSLVQRQALASLDVLNRSLAARAFHGEL